MQSVKTFKLYPFPVYEGYEAKIIEKVFADVNFVHRTFVTRCKLIKYPENIKFT